MSHVSQSRAASRASVVADDVHAAPTTTSAPMSASDEHASEPRSRAGSAGSRALRRARARRRRPPCRPRSVAGQPTPGHRHRRRAERPARCDEQRRREDERRRSRTGRGSASPDSASGSNGQEDRVEVDDPARRVAQSRREHALVAERDELPGLRAERDPRGSPGPRRRQPRYEPPPARTSAGKSASATTATASPASRGSSRPSQAAAMATRREQRREQRPTHEPPPRAIAPRALPRGRRLA